MNNVLLKSGPLFTVVLLATPLFLSTSVRAADNCKWYALTSAKQQKENEQKSCGFKGPQWSKNIKKHDRWCQGQPPQVWKSIIEKRQKALAGCR